VTAEEYDTWPEERSAGIEIVDGMVVMSPSPSKRHNLVAAQLAAGLRAAGRPGWRAGLDFDVRLRDVPLLNRRPDVVVFRADTLDVAVTRPEHILLIAEVVSPGSETVDREHKMGEYAVAGIEFYWRVERAATDAPVVYTYRLDPAGSVYRATEVFTAVVKTMTPFPVEIDLRDI
jgi:Uma2 family endonuclease